jgi:hypothetical protein
MEGVMKDVHEMTNAELDQAIAEMMGWMKCPIGSGAAGQYQYPIPDGSPRVVYSWHPTTDLNQAWEAEEWVIGRGDEVDLDNTYHLARLLNYENALRCVCGKPSMTVHATARQRCEAMILATRKEG